MSQMGGTGKFAWHVSETIGVIEGCVVLHQNSESICYISQHWRLLDHPPPLQVSRDGPPDLHGASAVSASSGAEPPDTELLVGRCTASGRMCCQQNALLS